MDLEFSCISYNVRGLKQKPKRIKIFNYLNEKVKKGFIFLQETHSIGNDILDWQNDWGGTMILNSGNSNSRGTLIAFTPDFDYKILKHITDDDGRIQICSIMFDERKLLLVNIYNENIEQKQVILLKKLDVLLESFSDVQDHEIIMGGDWNVILDKNLDASGGNPQLKLSSLSEITKIVEKYDLCDIFRIRNPLKRRFSFRQPTPRRLRRLDYFFISNAVQDRIKSCETLTSLSSDHSPVSLAFECSVLYTPGSNYWKFNSQHLKNLTFCSELSDVIENAKLEFSDCDPQTKWELVKFRIRSFCIKFSKKIAREKRERLEILEKNIEQFENIPANEHSISQDTYNENKLEFESLMDEKTLGYILRSKTEWYQNGEKSSKFFLNLEKKKGVQNTIKVLSASPVNSFSGDLLKNPKDISKRIKNFYSKLFTRTSSKSIDDCKQFLQNYNLPQLSQEQKDWLNRPLTLDELKLAIKNSQNGKSPGNDGLTREFFIVFWRNVSDTYFQSLLNGKEKGFLSTSQRQAVIKLLGKKKIKTNVLLKIGDLSVL